MIIYNLNVSKISLTLLPSHNLEIYSPSKLAIDTVSIFEDFFI